MNKNDLIRTTFPLLEKPLLEEIDNVSTFLELRTGQSILGEGDYIKSFPMILKGCLRVVRMSDEGKELLLYYLNRGEICAMSLTCCMVPQKSNIKMIAEEDSFVVTIPVDKPEKWISEYKSWKEFMMNSYRDRFNELLSTIDAIAFTRLDDRLARFFRERYKSTGKTIFNGTHQDIAFLLNTSREVVSRLLHDLENKKMVILRRNEVDYSNIPDLKLPV
jgi:CRP/FNR family transcriptional regulator